MTTAASNQQKSAYLEVLNGELANKCFALGQETIIGRNDDASALTSDSSDHSSVSPVAPSSASLSAPPLKNSINLSDNRVSRNHARIFRKKGRFYLEDTQSTNGTFLNTLRLAPGAPCLLREGCNVQVGGVHLRFRPGLTNVEAGEADREGLGFNEEMFDLSLTLGDSAIESHSDFSMIFRPSDIPDPDVSVMIDASALMAKLEGDKADITGVDGRAANTQVLRRLRAMTQMSIGLGAEKNQQALFAKIMDFIYEIFPSAERAFVVLQDEKTGEFHPVAASAQEHNEDGDVLELSQAIVQEVLNKRHSIISTDAATDHRFEQKETILSLGIRSVMCAPLLADNEVMGLIQVDTRRQTDSFDEEDLQVLTGIGAQVAVTLKNFSLYDDIERLFEGFVTASVHAIEARDPATAGHSFRVAEYTERLAGLVDGSSVKAIRDIQFSTEQMRELRYAALLHDFGKVSVREHVLIKGKKLYHTQMDLLQSRFLYAQASMERHAYRELIDNHSELSPSEFKARRQVMEKYLKQESTRLQKFFSSVKIANEPSILDDEVTEDLRSVADYVFPGEDGGPLPLITTPELEALTRARGSLTPEERLEIQSHVSHTYTFLNHIPWTGALSAVADIAHAHHEKMDGTGYPLGLTGAEIPIQSRIMAVADIFDALTAGDRPYKRSLSVEKALDILTQEAKSGKVDSLLVDVFIESRAYSVGRPVGR
ncbi:MAG: FHA domain-containing protein [Ectothiorhodospiraceae bacterium]|nr:FHA domain-containing protein [Ectothiorhodospiraceae bacterium]